MTISTTLSGVILGKDMQVDHPDYGKIMIPSYEIQRLKLVEGQEIEGLAFIYKDPFEGLGGYFYPGHLRVIKDVIVEKKKGKKVEIEVKE